MGSNSKWFSIEDAVGYLGIGKTVLYSLAREGRIPARKMGKRWIFEKAEIDAWMQAKQPLDTFFLSLDFNIEENKFLREPQRLAYVRVYEFFREGNNKAIIQMPVGCGKTGLASLLPLGIAEGRVLVIAPNLTIKKGLYDAMDVTNRRKCFWRMADILSGSQMIAGPFTCTLDSGNISVASKSHIVITNIQQLATNIDKWLEQFSDDFFNMIIIDEAHHSAAESWQMVLNRFPDAKVIHLTATPFRSDRQEIDGELVFRYSFHSATMKGYIKRLKASYVAPSEIELGFSDKRSRTYTLEEVLELKEEDWFSRGVALSQPCNQHIVDSSLEKLEELRESGTHHQLIAVTCSINHAREVRSLYEERGFKADVVHSKQSEEEKERILAALRNGTLDCIVQVQMLGEGFDHPKLSVAAIFRPFRTLAPYLQFVGRIMRVVVQKDIVHPDNLGHVVTHLGMNLDKRLGEFKQFDNDDHAFWENVIGGDETEIPQSVVDGSARLRAGETVVVRDEIVESLWEEDFSTIEDRDIIEDLRSRLKLYGLDPTSAEEMIIKARGPSLRKRKPSEPFPVQPQLKWKESRKRLDEQARRLASILLNHVELDRSGTEMTYRYKSLGLSGSNNYVSALMMVNKEINGQLGKEREQASIKDFERMLDTKNLEYLLQKLVRKVRKAKSDHEKKKA